MTPPAEPGVTLNPPRKLLELAHTLGGDVDDQARDVVVHRIDAPEHGSPLSLVPIFHAQALRKIRGLVAALLVPPDLAPRIDPGQRWVHEHARWVLARLLQDAAPNSTPASISTHAIVEPGASIAPNVTIGHCAVILAGSSIADGCRIEPHAVLYGGVRLGKRVVVGAGAVIGRPGFGWATGPEGQNLRMPQPGGVDIEDDVEIGPLVTIDAGTLKPTRLRRGCKLDAQVHVGHNVEIGRGTLVAAQTGFAGSVTVGDHVLVGGQTGVADHATIGDHARLAGRSGVIGPIAPHATVAGYPAVDRIRWLRAVARMMRGRS